MPQRANHLLAAADDRVQAVSVTGSVAAGRAVAHVAGECLKKSVLELGGSDTFVVLEDAHVDDAADTAVTARFLNTGQGCIAAKRFIVGEPIADQFGPVAAIIRVTDEEEAFAVANASRFGLGGSVWTQDEARGRGFAEDLECGAAFVNDMVKSDPRVPFGGIKESGYGRELSCLGIREFVNAKTVWIG